MAEQELNCSEVYTGFEQVGGKAVPECVRMNVFLDFSSQCSLPASKPDDFYWSSAFSHSCIGGSETATSSVSASPVHRVANRLHRDHEDNTVNWRQCRGFALGISCR